MAGKKKDMKGGRIAVLNSLFTRKKSNSNVEKNTYLQRIKKLGGIFTEINPSITVNDLVINTRTLLNFLTQIRNSNTSKIKKYDEFIPLLEQLKLILIQKLNDKLSTYYEIFKDHNPYNFSQLLRLLEDFKKLTDQINLLGGDERKNLGSLKIKKNQFIAAMLDKYEKEILDGIKKNTNTRILVELNEEVKDYIRQYKEYEVEIGINASINSIIARLSSLSNKISSLSTKNTGLQQNSSQQPSQQLIENKKLKKKEFINYLSSINDELKIGKINQIKIASLYNAFNAINKEIISNSDSKNNSNINKLLISIRKKINFLKTLLSDIRISEINPIKIDALNKTFSEINIEINKYSKSNSNSNIEKLLTSISEKIIPLVNITNNKQPNNKQPNNNSNYNIILERLEQKYPNKISDFGNLPTLATIASEIESIKKMNHGPKRIPIIKKLQDKIFQFEKKLGKYPEFQEYKEFAYPQ